MKRSVVFLRIAYGAGAALDAAMLPPMLVPSIGAAMFGISGFHPGAAYCYAMYVGASLMAGWTALLLWGIHRPVERRGVILLTVFPVILGLIGSSVFAAASGLVAMSRITPILGLQVLLGAFFVAAYAVSRHEAPAG